MNTTISNYVHACIHACLHTNIYIYIYIYIHVSFHIEAFYRGYECVAVYVWLLAQIHILVPSLDRRGTGAASGQLVSPP